MFFFLILHGRDFSPVTGPSRVKKIWGCIQDTSARRKRKLRKTKFSIVNQLFRSISIEEKEPFQRHYHPALAAPLTFSFYILHSSLPFRRSLRQKYRKDVGF